VAVAGAAGTPEQAGLPLSLEQVELQLAAQVQVLEQAQPPEALLRLLVPVWQLAQRLLQDEEVALRRH